MRNFHNKELSPGLWRQMIGPILAFLLAAALLAGGLFYMSQINSRQEIELLRQTVNRTVVECYAIEGIYPPDVEYMEENYQLSYDEDQYFIFYDCFSSNIMPVFEVYEKR